MNRTLLLLGVSLAGMAVGAIGATYVSAQGAAQITRTEILRKPMSGLEGKEVVVFLADIPPGGVAALHYIPEMRQFTCCKDHSCSSRSTGSLSS